MKETERYLSSMLKHFDGKESDTNWEAREQAIARLREIVHSANTSEEKASLARSMRSYGDAIGQSAHSLRTTLALEALALIGDIGTDLGYDLDPHTANTFLLHILRLASTPKRIIATRSMEVCTTFLSNTPYRHRTLQRITEIMDAKNIQGRHYAANYLKTMLVAHDGVMERSGGLDLAEKAVKKGLSDASPIVREACRQAFIVMQQHWPGRASRLAQSLDFTVQKSLYKTSTNPALNRSSTVRSSLSSCSSFSSSYSLASTASSSSSASSVSSASRPIPRSRLFSQPSVRTAPSNLLGSQKPLTPSPSQSTPFSQVIDSPKSTTATSLPRKRMHEEEMYDIKTKTQRHQNDLGDGSSIQLRHSNSSQLAVAALLQMLRSCDTGSNCRAIRRLSERLKHASLCVYDPSVALPDNVPSTTDLQPIFVGYLSRDTDDISFWKLLMSWDCVVGVYTRVLELEQYLPALILAKNRTPGGTASIAKEYRMGLQRLQLYLNQYDPQLPKHLLALLIAHVNSDDPRDNTLALYVARWLDGILCEYVGLGSDDDEGQDDYKEMKEGSDYYLEQDGEPAYPWFDDEVNIRAAMSETVSVLERISEDDKSGLGHILHTLIGRLRLSNERVFEIFSERFEVAIRRLPRRGGYTLTMEDFDFMPDEEEGMESSGATQDFSKMDLGVDRKVRDALGGAQQVADLEILPPQNIRDTLLQSLQERPTVATFKTWSRLSDEAPAADNDDRSSNFLLWTESLNSASSSGPFILVLEGIMTALLSEQDEDAAIKTVHLIKRLIQNQLGVLKYYEEATSKDNISSSISYLLAEALLITAASRSIKLSSVAEATFTKLLSALSDKQKLQIIWDLLREWLENNDRKSAVQILFTYLAKLVPMVEKPLLESTLASDVLIQGCNHSAITVRRACVKAIVGVHGVLGDEYIQTYLSPSLRIDQLNLLRYFIDSRS
ncbi:clasp N terminal-domain-containing protein [Fennellomyces sp. T-0311]|nr:clasp N terminal-domain-containing protein [Fennellomyces sp. T-0311]